MVIPVQARSMVIPSFRIGIRPDLVNEAGELDQHDVAQLAPSDPRELRAIARPIEGRDVSGSKMGEGVCRATVERLQPDVADATRAIDIRERPAVRRPAHSSSAVCRGERKHLQRLATLHGYDSKSPSLW